MNRLRAACGELTVHGGHLAEIPRCHGCRTSCVQSHHSNSRIMMTTTRRMMASIVRTASRLFSLVLTGVLFLLAGFAEQVAAQAAQTNDGAMAPSADSGPWEIPPWLYIVLAALLAAIYSYAFPKLQQWMEKRGD